MNCSIATTSYLNEQHFKMINVSSANYQLYAIIIEKLQKLFLPVNVNMFLHIVSWLTNQKLETNQFDGKPPVMGRHKALGFISDLGIPIISLLASSLD